MMTSNTGNLDASRGVNWRWVGWGGAVGLLALPFVAMQFTREVNWTGSDFVFAGVMLLLVGLAGEFFARRANNRAYRFAAAVQLLAAFLLIWVNGAVGFLGDEQNDANAIFLGVLAVALVGSIMARFRADAMAGAMLATAGTQLLAGGIGYAAGWASPGGEGVYEVVMGSTLFCGLWLLSAWFYRKAAQA